MVTIIKQTKYRLAKMWGTVLIGSATMKTNMGDARKKKAKKAKNRNTVLSSCTSFGCTPTKNEANERYTCRLKFTAILFSFTKLQNHPRAHHQINIYYIYIINGYYILYIIEVSSILFCTNTDIKYYSSIKERNYAICKK